MACFHPMIALRKLKLDGSENEQKIKFLGKKYLDNWRELLSPALKARIASGEYEALELPCGNCVGCRLERSRQWAIRCVHEASLHESNCFVTLTYDPDKEGFSPSLNKRDIVLFLKKLRKAVYPEKIRFFQCGEYGDQNWHPHHHLLLFGYDFPDKIKCCTSSGCVYYRSPELEKLWTHGFSSIGDLTFESAAYVARYVMKKLNGELAAKYEERGIIPPYLTMSRRSGIGADFFKKYQDDFYPKDFITFNDGQRIKPPKYYDHLFEQYHGEGSLESIKQKRKDYAESEKGQKENELARLKIKEYAALFKSMKSKRSGENYGNFSKLV